MIKYLPAIILLLLMGACSAPATGNDSDGDSSGNYHIQCYSGGVEIYNGNTSDGRPYHLDSGAMVFDDEDGKRIKLNADCIVTQL